MIREPAGDEGLSSSPAGGPLGIKRLGLVADLQLSKFLSAAYWKRFIQFNAVGLSGLVVNEGLLVLLTSWGIYYLLSDAIAIEVSILTNFVLNDLWTFSDRRSGFALARLAKFNTLMLVGLAINLLVLYVATDDLKIYYAISNVIGIGVAFLVRYFLSVKYAWRMLEKASRAHA